MSTVIALKKVKMGILNNFDVSSVVCLQLKQHAVYQGVSFTLNTKENNEYVQRTRAITLSFLLYLLSQLSRCYLSGLSITLKLNKGFSSHSTH